MKAELIDTQWDVNINVCLYCDDSLGINRYIVGCKLLHTRGRQYSAYELIDTQWDVNTTGTDSNKSLAAGINRYIVGCKSK